MRPDDIPAGLALCRSAGWNQLARDWELFLKINPEGCLVGLDEMGTVRGTVTTVRYQENFSWIGMVLVHPDVQRKGIGTGLLQKALSLATASQTIKLDATPAGREVYLTLNFKDEYAVNRMHIGDHSVDHLPASAARPVLASDIPEILKMDRTVFGADRLPVLESNFKAASQYAFVVENNNEIKGYCFGRPGFNFNHIGPLITDNVTTAKHLLSAALRKGEGKPSVIDILDHTPEWINFVSSLGFVLLRPLIRMYRGTNSSPGLPGNQFAILGPEFG